RHRTVLRAGSRAAAGARRRRGRECSPIPDSPTGATHRRGGPTARARRTHLCGTRASVGSGPRRTCRRRHRAARTAGRRALHPRGDADTARGPRQGSGMSVPRPAGSLSFVILGLSITSSWGNGHATTYRGLVRALAGGGHDVVFLERDAPWYADNRDLPRPPYGVTHLYAGVEELI